MICKGVLLYATPQEVEDFKKEIKILHEVANLKKRGALSGCIL